MARIGAILLEVLGTEGLARCQTHRADMVRGWACFLIGTQPGLDAEARLAAIHPLAETRILGCANGPGWPCARTWPQACRLPRPI